jgi:hypothetical protein
MALSCFTLTQNSDFLQGRQLPDFVKLANLQPHPKSRSFPDSNYALVLMDKEGSHRLYPTHDKASTWLSAQYVAENIEGMPKTAATIAARNIYGAATLFDVEIPPILKKLAAMAPAKTGRHYFHNPTEPVFHRESIEKFADGDAITIDGTIMPIRSCMELNRAEEWFGEKHVKMAQADKYALARFIVRRREELAPQGEKLAFTIHISDEATRVARLDTFNPAFRFNMLKRAGLCFDVGVCQDYVTLSKNEKIASISGPLAMIDQVERLDATGDMRQHYGRSIPSAIDSVLVHNKTAEEAEVEREETGTVKLGGSMGVGGVELPIALVRHVIKTGRMSKMLGAGMAEKLAKDPEAGLMMLPSEFGDMVLAESQAVRRAGR